MRVALLSLFAAGLAIGAVSTSAQARDYPYCVQGRQTGIPGDCSYQTYEQCQASASGRDAFCNVNPLVAFRQERYQRFQGHSRRGDGWPDERY